jgi:hypothetical protein
VFDFYIFLVYLKQVDVISNLNKNQELYKFFLIKNNFAELTG